jgi:GTP cyclohydrolase FolE2
VVRAPIAPHEIKSEMYCGVIKSKYSVAVGKRFLARSNNKPRAKITIKARVVKGKTLHLEDLIELAEQKASCELYAILKRILLIFCSIFFSMEA